MTGYRNIPETNEYILHVGPQGRIVIPAPMRKALGLKPGAVVLGRIEDNKVVLRPSKPLEELRAMFKNAKFSSTTLIAERRREARKEAKELRED